MSDIDINNDSVINFQLDERRARRMNLAKSALAATLDVADIGDAQIPSDSLLVERCHKSLCGVLGTRFRIPKTPRWEERRAEGLCTKGEEVCWVGVRLL